MLKHIDQEFSFTDCTSFVVMKELRLREALATDHHFRIAGFVPFVEGGVIYTLFAAQLSRPAIAPVRKFWRSVKASLQFLILLSLLGVVECVRAQNTTSKPAIFVCGDSTAKNSGKGKNGEPLAGWGTPIAGFFDSEKVVIRNVGHAGRSSRAYYDGDWPNVLPQIKAGDFVLLVFGINDGSTPPGLGEETVMRNNQPVHTYGWYLSKMATDAREKGARVYLLTVTTRNIWNNPKAKFNDATPVSPLPADYDSKQDRIERGTGNGRFTRWTKDVGQKLRLPVFDLTNFCADKYEAMGREEVNKFYSDHNHTYLAGAEFVATSIVSGLKAFKDSPFIPLLSEKGRAIETAAAKYVSDNPGPKQENQAP